MRGPTVECLHEVPLFKTNNLLHLHAKRGSMVDARHVFDNMPMHDLVTWNTMILGYAKQEEGALALEFYAMMHKKGVQRSARTLVSVLKACSSLAQLEEGKRVDGKFVKIGCLGKGRAIHSQVLKSGFQSNIFVATTLVDVYTKCGSMEDARHVFDKLPYRDGVSWNAMILGYAEQEEGVLALDLYVQMRKEDITPDHLTFVGALKACSSLAILKEEKQVDGEFLIVRCLEEGKDMHSQVVTSGFESNAFVGTTLVDMYMKCGSMEDAQHVFDELSHRNVVSCTAMILGYIKQEKGALALDLFARMQKEGIRPDDRSFVGALKACSSMAALEEEKQVDRELVGSVCLEKGRTIHCQVIKGGFESDIFVGTTLLDMYVKCRSMEDARWVFDKLPYRDVVTWTSMILGYAEQEGSEEALRLYAQMQEQGLSQTSLTFVAILKSCSNIGALETGKELHAQIIRVGLETILILANSLIDIYAKCESMVDALWVFDSFPVRDVVTWNALIAGYARQGESGVVFCLFDRMRGEGIQPNRITFLSVLTVCSHVGLVEKGQKYFQTMTKQYSISPNPELYNCMVDLLSRAGQVNEALVILEKMPFQPNAVVWLTLLSACQKWKNVDVAIHAFESAVRLNENLSAAYVLISNIYVEAHM